MEFDGGTLKLVLSRHIPKELKRYSRTEIMPRKNRHRKQSSHRKSDPSKPSIPKDRIMSQHRSGDLKPAIPPDKQSSHHKSDTTKPSIPKDKQISKHRSGNLKQAIPKDKPLSVHGTVQTKPSIPKDKQVSKHRSGDLKPAILKDKPLSVHGTVQTKPSIPKDKQMSNSKHRSGDLKPAIPKDKQTSEYGSDHPKRVIPRVGSKRTVQVDKCDSGHPKRASLHAYGIHVLPLTPSDEKDHCPLIISVSEGEEPSMNKQYGPDLSQDDVVALTKIMTSRHPKRMMRSCGPWYIVDIMRVLSMSELPLNVEMVDDYNRLFPLHCTFDDDDIFREASAELAKHHGQGRSSHSPHEDVDCDPFVMLASKQVCATYMDAINLFRMKWLEIQDLYIDVKGYTISKMRRGGDGEDDPEAPEAGTTGQTRYKLTLTQWESHVRDGTILFAEVDDQHLVELDVLRTEKRTVIFSMEESLEEADIKGLIISRANETLMDINEQLHIGCTMMTEPSKYLHGSRYVQSVFGVAPLNKPSPTDQTGNPTLRPINRSRAQESRATRKRYETLYAKRIKQTLTTRIPEDIASPVFTELNPEQSETVESKAWVTLAEGYPGTGKTKAAAAYILARFRDVLAKPCGYVVILTNSNASALNMLKQVSRYPSLRPYITHAYSEQRAAFEPAEFEVAYPYRLTKKKRLGMHGILICTIGSLRRVVQKYKHFGKTVVDLITDESGQIWSLNSLLFLCHFPNLQRWLQVGDRHQLSPYISKLVKFGKYYPSVMSMFMGGDPLTTHSRYEDVVSIRLRVQYRMNLDLCMAHAPVFYSYGITTFRKEMANPKHDGAYYANLVLPEAGEASIRAAGVYGFNVLRKVQQLQLVSETGVPYTYAILTTNVDAKEEYRRMASERGVTNCTIATVDSIQGTEFNVVIILPSIASCSSLYKCPQRGNVMLSRARDMVILCLPPKFPVATVPKTRTEPARLRFWGRYLMCPIIKLFDPPASRAQYILSQLSGLQRDLDGSKPVQHGNRFRIPTVAQRALASGPEAISAPAVRREYARQLCLKKDYWGNKSFHMNLYHAMATCDSVTFTGALQICIDTDASDHRGRNAKLMSFLDVDFKAGCPQEVVADVKTHYTRLEKPRRRAQRDTSSSTFAAGREKNKRRQQRRRDRR